MNTQTTPEAVKHTATHPYTFHKTDTDFMVIDGHGNYVARTYSSATAQMIVDAPTMKAQIEELTRQRDEFKKSLIRLRDAVNNHATPDNLKAALMNAEYIIYHV